MTHVRKRGAKPFALPLLAAALSSYAQAKVTPQTSGAPEKEASALGEVLKGVPDDQWKTIAGEKLTERYTIVQGDSLYAISKRLFGDGKYWPKVWALNNGGITNPHLIYPGGAVAFEPGTATSLPQVAMPGETQSNEESSAKEETPVVSRQSGRSTDWMHLPPQKWEKFDSQLPPQIDPSGFDRRSRITFSKGTLLDLPWLPSSERIPYMGRIAGSRSEADAFFLQDTLYIEPEGDLQLGETYAITTDPQELNGRVTGRSAYGYPILGKVKLTGVRDNMFVGQVVAGEDTFNRKMSLIKLPPRVPQPAPLAGPSAMEGTLIYGDTTRSELGAQHQIVFIDRGAKDAVQPGMIFRVYEYTDPGTGDTMTSADFVPVGDVMVVRAEDSFSTAIIIRSSNLLKDQSRVVLLTDISEFLPKSGVREKGDENPQPKKEELDELDQLDAGGLGKEEEKELQQLEKWKGNPSEAPPPAEAAPPPPAEAPSDVAPPPPTETPPPGDALPPPPSDSNELPPPTSDGPPPPPPADGAVGPGADVPPPPPSSGPETAPIMEAPPLPPPADGAASSESQAIDQMIQNK